MTNSKLKYVATMLTSMLALYACGASDLTNENAQALIERHINEVKKENKYIPKWNFSLADGCSIYGDFGSAGKKYFNGLVLSGYFKRNGSSCEPTEKIKDEILKFDNAYSIIDIVIGKIVITNIDATKLDDGKKAALVKFHYKYDLNPIGQSLQNYYSGKPFKLFSGEEGEGSAQLSLYDVGWQVEAVDLF